MLSNIKRISRSKASLWNLFFSYTSIGYAVITGLFLVPLYLAHIPLDLYGAWLATGNVLNWLLVVDPGLSNVIQQRVARSFGAADLEATGAYAVAGIVLTACIVVIVLIAGVAISPYLAQLVNLPSAADHSTLVACFLIALCASGLTLLSFTPMNVNLGMQSAFAHGLITITGNLATVVATITLLFLGFGLYALAWGMMARAITFAVGGFVFMLWNTRRYGISLSIQKEKIREVLGLLSFTSLGKVGGLLSKNMDAFLIARFLGPSMVPVYVLTRRGFSIAEMLLNRTGNAIGPSLAHLSGEGGGDKMRSILVRLFSLNIWVLGLAFGGFLAFNDDFVRLWVGPKLFAGSAVSIVLCLLLVASVSGTILQTICVALGDIKRNAVAQFVQSAVVFVGLLIGILYFGLLGAAVAHLIGFLVVSSWYYPRSLARRSTLNRVDLWIVLKEASVALGLGLLLGLGFHALQVTGWASFTAAALVFASVYALVLVGIRPPLRREIRAFLSWLRERLLGRKILHV